jgi:beta-galactosidase
MEVHLRRKKSPYQKVENIQLWRNYSDDNSGIQAGETAELKIDGIPDTGTKESYLEFSFTLREATNWGKPGHEIAFGQLQLKPAPTFSQLKATNFQTAPRCKKISPQLLEINGSENVKWKFNIVHGTLVSWNCGGEELIHTPPMMDFYRAQTDNDSPSEFGKSWTRSYLHQTKSHTRSVSWRTSSKNVEIIVEARIAPPVLDWAVYCTFMYNFTDKHLSIKVKGQPVGCNIPATFARIGLTMGLSDIQSATWFGRGPGESYTDKKESQRIGTYSTPVDNLFTDYEFPQESGNRTDTRWVEFKGKKSGLKACFADLKGASFTALHYTTKDIDECRHPYELHKKKRKETIVRLDWAHHGLGTGSCGPSTLPQYELKSGPFEYEILLE